MKLLKNSWNVAKTLSVTLSTCTMVMAPVAQAAGTARATQAAAVAPVKVYVDYSKYNWNVDKKGVQDFLKFTGLGANQKMTYGEFYQKVRPYYPATLRRYMDIAISANRTELMPQVEATTYRDSEGKEQIRLLLTKNGQTASLSYNPGSKDKYLKFNNTDIARVDLLYFEQMYRKLAHGDPTTSKEILKGHSKTSMAHAPLKMNFETFMRLSPKQRANYFVRMRELVRAAEKASFKMGYGKSQASETENKYEYFAQWVLGLQAQAEEGDESHGTGPVIKGARAGQRCIVAGYVSIYGTNTSCGGGSEAARANLAEKQKLFGAADCPKGKVGCNKLLYNKMGSTVCVTNPGEVSTASWTTGKCAAESPLKTLKDKENLINGYFKSKNIDLGIEVDENDKIAKGKMTPQQYAEMKKQVEAYMLDVQGYVNDVMHKCANKPLSLTKAQREDQEKACDGVALRKFTVDFYDFNEPTVVVPPPIPPPVTKDCSFEKPGGEGENCDCVPPKKEMNIEDPERGKIIGCAEVIVEDRTPVPVECKNNQTRNKDTGKCEEECKGLLCGTGWMWLVGGLLAAGGLFYWLSKKDDKPQTPVAVDPCPTAKDPLTLTCLPVTPPPVTPPPVQPPPIIPGPPTAPTVVPTVTPVEVVPVPVPTTTVETTGNGTGAPAATGSAR